MGPSFGGHACQIRPMTIVAKQSPISPTVELLYNVVVATEASDDDGLPHTLEHLIFLGSEDYPFKACFV